MPGPIIAPYSMPLLYIQRAMLSNNRCIAKYGITNFEQYKQNAKKREPIIRNIQR